LTIGFGWVYSAVAGFIMGILFSALIRGGELWRNVGDALLMGIVYGFAIFVVHLLSLLTLVNTLRGG
jgi:hypothetical protein